MFFNKKLMLLTILFIATLFFIKINYNYGI
ncbi:hypothetical protein SAMN05444274_102170 [Mariniphaga anaerophila]|uniref:Uncharacterized protein n=1 Tax=Mariniphaga anaerophila TaxID=1484053 RepID=A0A1M4VPY0_9BACT|nr:hypothetical protein SAMN05444274_102170 [Mariniphaga anaerophila]